LSRLGGYNYLFSQKLLCSSYFCGVPSCGVSLEWYFQYLQLLYDTLLNPIFTRGKVKIKNLLKRNLPTPVGSAERNFLINSAVYWPSMYARLVFNVKKCIYKLVKKKWRSIPRIENIFFRNFNVNVFWNMQWILLTTFK